MKLSEQLRIGTERTKRWKSAAGHILIGEKEIVEIAQLEEENEALKRELRTERRTTLGALLDSGAISLVQWEEGMEQLALLTAEESE